MSSGFSISELARHAGVGVETIRFYERRGLLPEPPRSASGYRVFPADAIRRVKFIRRAQGLGFSLAEVAELLDLRVTPGTTCAAVRERTRRKIVEIDCKLTDLQRMRTVLERLEAACDTAADIGECPILEALEHGVTARNRKDEP